MTVEIALPQQAPPREDLLRHLAGWLGGYGPRTRDSYRADLKNFLAFCATAGVDPLEAKLGDVRLWAQSLTEVSGLAPGTVARRISAVSSFYRYLARNEVVTGNPAEFVRRPKASADSPRSGFTAAELKATLAAAKAAGPVEYALVCLLGLQGLRVSEACGLTEADLLTVFGQRCARVYGKGGKEALVPLGGTVCRALDALLDYRRGHPASTALAVVVGQPPRVSREPLIGLNRWQARRVVVQAAKKAGVGHRTSHDARHAFVTLLLDAGQQLHDVQRAARHSQPATTERYWRTRGRLNSTTSAVMDRIAGDESC